MIVPESYTGPRFEDSIDEAWVINLIDYFKDQKTLHKKYAALLIQKAKTILSE